MLRLCYPRLLGGVGYENCIVFDQVGVANAPRLESMFLKGKAHTDLFLFSQSTDPRSVTSIVSGGLPDLEVHSDPLPPCEPGAGMAFGGLVSNGRVHRFPAKNVDMPYFKNALLCNVRYSLGHG